MDREQETELIIRWRDLKDEDAARQLWQQVLSNIEDNIGRLAGTLGFKSEYQDVLHETFLEVKKNIIEGKYIKRRGRLSTYSFGIARIKLLEMNAKRKRSDKALQIYSGMKNQGIRCDPVTEEVVRREEVVLWAKAISELPESTRSVFCCRAGIWPYEEALVETIEFSIKDVAELYDQSRGWVWQQYTKATKILQKKLLGKVN